MFEYRVAVVSVWVWRRPGQSDKAYRKSARSAGIRHERMERKRSKAFQRDHAGSLRGYQPIPFGKA